MSEPIIQVPAGPSNADLKKELDAIGQLLEGLLTAVQGLAKEVATLTLPAAAVAGPADPFGGIFGTPAAAVGPGGQLGGILADLAAAAQVYAAFHAATAKK